MIATHFVEYGPFTLKSVWEVFSFLSFAKPKFTGSAFGQIVKTQQKLKPGKVNTAADVQETNYERVIMNL